MSRIPVTLSILLLQCTLGALAQECTVEKALTYFSPRSQAVRSFRQWIGFANDYSIHRFNECEMYSVCAVTFEYQHNFNVQNITHTLFGDALTAGFSKPTIVISGSDIAQRGPRDWLADYFGLPTDFQSNLTFDPSVTSAIFDFDYYIGLNDWAPGLYFRIHAPLVHTTWDIGLCEQIINPGINGYPAGYFTPEQVERHDLLNNFTEYVGEGKVPRLNNNVSFESLASARMNPRYCDTLTATRLAEVRAAFGYDILSCEDYHLAVAARTAIPAGSRPQANYLFEPIVGNGHHWELGGEIQGHYTFFGNCQHTWYAGIYVDLIITNLFKTDQCRTFDICNSPASRYMLAERITTPVNVPVCGNLQASTCNNNDFQPPVDGYTPVNSQFQRIFTPIANVTRSEMKVSGGTQTDLTILFDFNWCNWELDLGYGLWSRTCSNVNFSCPCPPVFEQALYALKGDAYVYGFAPEAIQGTELQAAPLSATQSKATLFAGTNRPCGEPIDQLAQQTNQGIDNQQFAYGNIDDTTKTPLFGIPTNGPCSPELLALQTRTSLQPIHLTQKNVDVHSSESRGLSNTFFAALVYHSGDHMCNYIPFLSVGGSIEYAHCSGKELKNCTQACLPAQSCTDCCDCIQCSLTQWSLIIKGGISF